jgi:hypothetical protein
MPLCRRYAVVMPAMAFALSSNVRSMYRDARRARLPDQAGAHTKAAEKRVMQPEESVQTARRLRDFYVMPTFNNQ